MQRLAKEKTLKKGLLLMPRNTSLPIITGREKGVKMSGFKLQTLFSRTEKSKSYAKITKALKKVLQRKKWLEQ